MQYNSIVVEAIDADRNIKAGLMRPALLYLFISDRSDVILPRRINAHYDYNQERPPLLLSPSVRSGLGKRTFLESLSLPVF